MNMMSSIYPSYYEGKTHYRQQDKGLYLQLCRKYNQALKESPVGEDFIRLSIAIHAAKANVPKAWGKPSFIAQYI